MVAHVTASQSGVWCVTSSDVTLYTTWLQGDAINWARNYLRVRGGGELVIYGADGKVDQQDRVPNALQAHPIQN